MGTTLIIGGLFTVFCVIIYLMDTNYRNDLSKGIKQNHKKYQHLLNQIKEKNYKEINRYKKSYEMSLMNKGRAISIRDKKIQKLEIEIKELRSKNSADITPNSKKSTKSLKTKKKSAS